MFRVVAALRRVSELVLTADRAATTPSENEVQLAMHAQLETILRRYLVLVPEEQEVPLETELPALGLDSMSALTLLLELEEIFDISFPDSLLSATTFRSANSLDNAIQMLRNNGMATAEDAKEA
jgi:acyl carrier protein